MNSDLEPSDLEILTIACSFLNKEKGNKRLNGSSI